MSDGPDWKPPDRSDDPRARRSRAALRAALVDLLGTGSIEKVTVLALATRAGVGYATFFRNYADIEALLSDVADDAIADLALLLEMSALPPIEIARSIAKFFAERRGVLTPLFVGASASLERRIIVQATRAAAAGQRMSTGDIPDGLALTHVVRTSLNILQWWLGDGRHATQESVARLIERLAFSPILARSD